jgi:hypothetical protein
VRRDHLRANDKAAARCAVLPEEIGRHDGFAVARGHRMDCAERERGQNQDERAQNRPLVHQWGYGTIPVMALLGLVISLLLAIDKRASSGGPRVDPSMIVEQDRGHMEEISKETK